MVKIVFKEPYRGVKDIVCKFTTAYMGGKGKMVTLHFTKDISWSIEKKLIESENQIDDIKL